MELSARKSGDDTGRVSRWAARLEAVLWLTGAILLGSVAWTVADAYRFQHAAARELETSWNETALPRVGASDENRTARLALGKAKIVSGTPLARLSIPRLGASAIVAEGIEESVLRRALGHLPGTALPGENGNVALAGHRDTFFRALDGVVVGDELILESGAGSDRYQVEWAAVVEPAQTAVARDAGYAALTLVTCYPFGYLGDAPYRYVIRARRVASAGGAVRQVG
jgi:sortase A